ncbi:hypothetical protein L1049_004383 [Liquidambar formosana]|uniref:Uncharacterized protein n=1 Tax=Liquidambar formosana TaxID=63359 RepID=A0AAP0RTA3_LIQFO
MGNCTSCSIVHQSNRHTAKLFDAQGNLRRVKTPITAAELMVEDPGHVISPVNEICRTRRILAMRADDELSAGRVYMMVPVHRVNCRVSEMDVAIMESACAKRWRQRGSSKVLPDGIGGKRESSEGPVKVLDGGDTGFPSNRMGSYRQWNPVLEPISESEGC